ncbi:MAG TPA: transglutaminaseTgpA domain-containing protein, partial [Micromonospora sp.]
MTAGTRRLGLVAAAATLLASAPLSTVFDRWTWLIQCVIAVGMIAGAAALVRSLAAPVWVQPLGMLVALVLALSWMFPSGHELLGLLPTHDTLARFAALASGSVTDMRTYGVPVADTDPLLFVTVLGVGAVALVVDLLTVVLRRPALAGLPMLAIYSVPVAVHSDSVPPVPFVVGSLGFLWLLVADNVERVRRFGRRFTGDGRDVDVWEPSPLAAAGRRLAVVGVVVAVLLPVAVPGMTAGLLDTFSTATGEGDGSTGTGRTSGRVDLFAALSGQLNLSEVNDMVRVTTSEEDPFYLRFGVADNLVPEGFRVRSPKGVRADDELPDPRDRVTAGVNRESYRATVEVTENFTMPLLPVYAEPVRVTGVNSRWFYDPDLQVVFSRSASAKGRKYSFDYVRSSFGPEALRAARRLPTDHPIRQMFTATPPVTRVQQLVTELTQGKRTDYDRVRAIYDYFSQDNGFRYSLNTKGGTSGQDIVDFLDNK